MPKTAFSICPVLMASSVPFSEMAPEQGRQHQYQVLSSLLVFSFILRVSRCPVGYFGFCYLFRWRLGKRRIFLLRPNSVTSSSFPTISSVFGRKSLKNNIKNQLISIVSKTDDDVVGSYKSFRSEVKAMEQKVCLQLQNVSIFF